MTTDDRTIQTVSGALAIVVAGVALAAALAFGGGRLLAVDHPDHSDQSDQSDQSDHSDQSDQSDHSDHPDHSDHSEVGGPAGPVPGAAGAALRAAVPGLYVPDDVVAILDPSGTVTMQTPRSCAELTDILLAGDWRRTQRLDVPAEAAPILAIGGLTPMTLLRQGDSHALLTSSDRPDGCRAVVSVAPPGATSIDAGIASLGTPGWAHTTRCIRTDSTLSVSVVAGGDGMSAVLQLVVDGEGPDRTASLDDSTDSMLVFGDVGVLDVLSAALAAELGGASEDAGGVSIVDGSGSSGRASVEDTDGVVRGTVELAGATWFDEQNGRSGELSVALPFACPEVTLLS